MRLAEINRAQVLAGWMVRTGGLLTLSRLVSVISDQCRGQARTFVNCLNCPKLDQFGRELTHSRDPGWRHLKFKHCTRPRVKEPRAQIWDFGWDIKNKHDSQVTRFELICNVGQFWVSEPADCALSTISVWTKPSFPLEPGGKCAGQLPMFD